MAQSPVVPGFIKFSQIIIQDYDVTLGSTGFISTEISNFSILAVQFSWNLSSIGTCTLKIQQSINGTDYDDIINSEFTIASNTGSITVERNTFTGKFCRIDVDVTGSIGTISAELLAKR